MPHVPDTVPGKRVTDAGARPEGRGQPSNIRGGSRMRESCTYGSMRGAPSNGRPYRNREMTTIFEPSCRDEDGERALGAAFDKGGAERATRLYLRRRFAGRPMLAARAGLVPGLPLMHPTFYIRPAQVEEAAALSDLCFRSKAMWGYDPGFMALMPAAHPRPHEHEAGEAAVLPVARKLPRT